jgi:polyribonucleotide nucleotidyltransferase
MIAAQKELAAKAGKPKREDHAQRCSRRNPQGSQALAGDRFVPALLTPGKLNREAACKAIQDEVGAKLVEKFGAEKVTRSSSRTPSTTSRRKRSAA